MDVDTQLEKPYEPILFFPEENNRGVQDGRGSFALKHFPARVAGSLFQLLNGVGRSLSQALKISPQTKIPFKLDNKVFIGFIKPIQKFTDLDKGLNVMDKKKIVISSFFVALLLILGVLLNSLPEGNLTKKYNDIKYAKIGSHELYIPKDYLKFSYTSVGVNSALLQAWYPGNGIPPESHSQELINKGIWWKNVRLLMNLRKSEISFQDFALKKVQHLDAFQKVGSEYGLIHYTQPEGYVQDKRDIWLEKEDDKIISYIACSEKLIPNGVPLCSHVFYHEKYFWLKVHYSRKLLPEWKLIKDNVQAMLASFKSEESAKKFIDSIKQRK